VFGGVTLLLYISVHNIEKFIINITIY